MKCVLKRKPYKERRIEVKRIQEFISIIGNVVCVLAATIGFGVVVSIIIELLKGGNII